MADVQGNIAVSFTQFNMVNNDLAGIIMGFLYNPTTLTMENSSQPTTYEVIFTLTSNIPGALLVSELTLGPADPPPGASALAAVPNTTNQWSFTFTNSGVASATEGATFHYAIKARANGRDFTSSDPEIVLGPPPG